MQGIKAKGSGNQEGLPRRNGGTLPLSPRFERNTESEAILRKPHMQRLISGGEIWGECGMLENSATFIVYKKNIKF